MTLLPPPPLTRSRECDNQFELCLYDTLVFLGILRNVDRERDDDISNVHAMPYGTLRAPEPSCKSTGAGKGRNIS
jgi:hypothetical protein